MEAKTVNFSVDPVWLTQFVRNLWSEGSYGLAMDTLDCLIGLPEDIKPGVIRGTYTLTKDFSWEEDDWSPNLEMCNFGQYPDPLKLWELAEKGAKLERDVERLQDMVVGLSKRLMQEGPGDGEFLADVERNMTASVPPEALERNEVETRTILDLPSGRVEKTVYGNLDDGYTTKVGFAAGLTGKDIARFRDQVPSVEEYVAKQLELDIRPLPSVDANYVSDNGYVTPDGRYYPCEWLEHMWLASKIEEVLHIPECQLVKMARSQLAPTAILAYLPSDGYEPSIEQIGTTVLWCLRHDVDLPDWTHVEES